MAKELPPKYDFPEVEDRIYRFWESEGYFKPEVNPEGDPFCIIMPPPNANGALHIGHAIGTTLQDIMTRYARMQGKAALWLPGADHAGFETQVVFEKKLEKEGKSRFQIPREELYQMMWDFTQSNKKTMENQIRKLGASCDWSREKFTLDPDIIKIVYKTFKDLYEDGLVYRGFRLANWCPKHQTSFSDLELNHIERQDPLYFVKYGSITVATTRPETMFADVAIAVNPKDERYTNLIGKEVPLPLTNRTIPVIADEDVDLEFGTGAVKITPAHDQVDFEIGKRHDLALFSVVNDFGKMVFPKETGADENVIKELEGKKASEAREIVAKELEQEGLMDRIDNDYTHSVSTCYKCGSIIEPLPKVQWYVAVNKKGEKSGKILSKDALKAVREGKTKFVTKRYEKIFCHWMSIVRDWNISRQVVWGIRIPAWFCPKCDPELLKPIVQIEGEPKHCPHCQSSEIIQDPDVFDTWFSSGQWPFVTLMSLSEKDFKKFYPTTVMETAWDILFFWISRMMMLGLYATDKTPFENVYIHGLVRDKDKQKMSKSKGNVIDPLGIIELYGTDAVRMALVFGTSAGNDIIISEDKIRGMRNFATKAWNISRFVLMNLEDEWKLSNDFTPNTQTAQDEEILKQLLEVQKETTRLIDLYRFPQAAEMIYEFIWHKFADIYIEEAKKQIQDESLKQNTQQLLLYVLANSLKLLHPFMPFITEEIWDKLPIEDKKALIISSWPK